MSQLEDIFRPHQGEEPPKLDDASFKEVQRVELGHLPEGTLVRFSGVHPASNYILKVLGSPELGNQREIKLWYVGSGELNLLGTPACFIGPGKGCLQTKAKTISSVSPHEEGVLEVRKQYELPTFRWDGRGNLYVIEHFSDLRFETYTKIQLQTKR